MEHIHDLSAKLQKGDFAYLGGVFGDGLALFRFEQAVLGFTQFDTRQVAQFIAVDRNPVVFLCRDQVLFFQAPQVQVVAISHPEVAHIGPQSQFESFKDPLVVMFTVPLAIAGALIFMSYSDITMNIFSQIGIIMLIGLVAKNGILIVEFANQRQEAGLSMAEAIRSASTQRLRPILMTSISTILGLVPLVYASGEGAQGRIAMGIAVVGGMIVSTFLTLFIVPAMYSFISTDRQSKINN